jgi:hypothetical protein
VIEGFVELPASRHSGGNEEYSLSFTQERGKTILNLRVPSDDTVISPAKQAKILISETENKIAVVSADSGRSIRIKGHSIIIRVGTVEAEERENLEKLRELYPITGKIVFGDTNHHLIKISQPLFDVIRKQFMA